MQNKNHYLLEEIYGCKLLIKIALRMYYQTTITTIIQNNKDRLQITSAFQTTKKNW